MSDRKLKAWQNAGLIDAETAARIDAWEAANSRPLGLWALVGLGALAIGLGLVSLVAANWDAIPGEVRLGIHFAVMTGVALLIWIAPRQTDANDHFHDAILFIAAVLGLTFFGHLGQVYQTSSPLWQPLLAWLILFSPLLLLFGRGWPVAGLWFVAVLGTAWAHVDTYERAIWVGTHRIEPSHPILYWGLIMSPPMIVAALAALMRGHSARPQFWRLLEQMALVTILAAVSIVVIVSAWDRPDEKYLGSFAIQSLLLLSAAGIIRLTRPTRSGMATAGILCVAALIHLGQASLIQLGGREGPWIGALSFFILWGAVAYAALFAGWRRLFQCATAFIAIRIILLSFELGDDLLGSGVSLILSGLVAIGVAWGTVRISRHYAPPKGAA